jgi:hypothetical protein
MTSDPAVWAADVGVADRRWIALGLLCVAQ